MVLVDTSVWIAHLRNDLPSLRELLLACTVATHPFVIGELACGQIHNRLQVFSLIRSLPQVKIADHDEVFRFIHDHRLMGKGLGWIDVHLLASAALSHVHLWTSDKPLASSAKDLHLAFQP